MEFFKRVPSVDFMAVRMICILGSAALILIGVASLIIKKGPDLGVEFTGGVIMELHFKEAPPLDKVRASLAAIGQGDALIQQFGDREDVLIRLREMGTELGQLDQAVTQSLQRQFTPGAFEVRRVEAIGPAVSRDLLRQALFAVFYSLLGILIYVGFRFRFAWGVGGVVALLHDLIITAGFLSLAGREWTLPIVAAFLTIAGYSINDTIVVFDRIRENVRLRPRDDLGAIINASVNQTLSRTTLTSGTVLLVTLALLFWGGEVLKDFALALTIGVIVGTYSSIFIASPIVLFWYRGAKRA